MIQIKSFRFGDLSTHKKSRDMEISRKFRNRILLFVILVIASIFSILNPTFLRPQSMMNLVSAVSVLSIAAIGQSLILLTGGMDLSIGSSLGLAAALSVMVTNATGNPFLGFLTAIVTTTGIGLINGIMVGKFSINVVVLTLGMMGAARSISMVITNNTAIKVVNTTFNALGGGYFETKLARIPYSFFIIIIAYGLFSQILSRTTFGRKIAAVGGNRDAARTAGIPVNNIILFVYTLTGFLIGLACIIDVGRVSSFHPYSGVGLEFDALTAAILGGVSMKGGKLDILGTLLGVILLGVIITGLSLLNIYVYYVQIIKGLLLLAAVLVNTYFEQLE